MITAEMLLAGTTSQNIRRGPVVGGVTWVCGYMDLTVLANHLNRAQWRDDTPPLDTEVLVKWKRSNSVEVATFRQNDGFGVICYGGIGQKHYEGYHPDLWQPLP